MLGPLVGISAGDFRSGGLASLTLPGGGSQNHNPTGRLVVSGAGVRRGGGARFAGGGHRAAAFRGGGGFRGRGGGGFRGGGGRRSDIRLKHDVVLLGWLDNGLGYYCFAYNGSKSAYVGVIAQEVSALRPDAVARGRHGYLRVSYERLGLHFQSYHDWTASGARLPHTADPP